MKRFFNDALRKKILADIQLLLGCAIGAAAYPLFLTPGYISPGGLTGITTVLSYLYPGLPVGLTSLALNVPLFLIGLRYMGRRFAARSLVATVLFSVLIDLMPFEPVTLDPLLAAVFGGVLLGVGLGLILRSGATTGGTDMAARMLHRRVQHLSVGTILFMIDCISVLMAAISIEIEHALYALICIFLSDRVVDAVLVGGGHELACYVISDRYDDVKRQLLEKLERGVTVLRAEGGYTGKDKPVLLCVLTAREVPQLKAIVRSTDKDAFVFTTGANEVLGEGFGALTQEDNIG